MKVLFLGAGASIPAGYPATSDLLRSILAESGSSPDGRLRRAFDDWNDLITRAETLGLDRQLLGFPNPEVPLSYLDLWAQAIDEAPAHWFREAVRTGDADASALAQWSSERARVADRGGRAMREMLNAYFKWKGYLDGKPDYRSKREYLRTLFSSLRLGDFIITLNWDTTAERTLAEDGRRRPKRRYGFGRAAARVFSRSGSGPKRFPATSEVTVLKLHGGVGWHRDPSSPDGLYLSTACRSRSCRERRRRDMVIRGVRVRELFATARLPGGPSRSAGYWSWEIPSYWKHAPTGRDMKRVWSRAEWPSAPPTRLRCGGTVSQKAMDRYESCCRDCRAVYDEAV